MRLGARRAITLLLGCLLLVTSCGSGDRPAGPRLRIMVPNVAGGGYDLTARTAAAIAQRSGVVDERIAVFNVDGDGGAVALRRLIAERGNGELAMMMGLGVVGATVTRPGSDQVTAATPIARLIQESQAVLVPAGSRHRSIGELVAAWRADPASTPLGGGSALGGPDHLMAMRPGSPGRCRRRLCARRTASVDRRRRLSAGHPLAFDPDWQTCRCRSVRRRHGCCYWRSRYRKGYRS